MSHIFPNNPASLFFGITAGLIFNWTKCFFSRSPFSLQQPDKITKWMQNWAKKAFKKVIRLIGWWWLISSQSCICEAGAGYISVQSTWWKLFEQHRYRSLSQTQKQSLHLNKTWRHLTETARDKANLNTFSSADSPSRISSPNTGIGSVIYSLIRIHIDSLLSPMIGHTYIMHYTENKGGLKASSSRNNATHWSV